MCKVYSSIYYILHISQLITRFMKKLLPTILISTLLLPFVVSALPTMDMSACQSFASSKPMRVMAAGPDVLFLQQLLNKDPDTAIARSGPGSPGNEVSTYGKATRDAVKKFQSKYKDVVLTPYGYTMPTGVVGQATRNQLVSLYCGVASAQSDAQQVASLDAQAMDHSMPMGGVAQVFSNAVGQVTDIGNMLFNYGFGKANAQVVPDKAIPYSITWSSTGAAGCRTSWDPSIYAASGTSVLTVPALYGAFNVSCIDEKGNQTGVFSVTIPTLATTTPPVIPPPSVTLNASLMQVPFGGTTTLSWNSSNATKCYAVNVASGLSGSVTVGGLTTNTVFVVTCGNDSGLNSATVSVTVVPRATDPNTWYPCAGGILETCYADPFATSTVRFGAAGMYKIFDIKGSFPCNMYLLGGDPAPGKNSTCDILGKYPTPKPEAKPSFQTQQYAHGWNFCSNPFSGCSFPGPREVRWGSTTTNAWVYQMHFGGVGGLGCRPEQFGKTSVGKGDHCEYADVGPSTALPMPTTMQMGGLYPTPDLSSVPVGDQGRGDIGIASTTDFGVQGFVNTSTIGAFRIPCAFSHFANDDPIVYPGKPGASHLHVFFGNKGTNAYSTAESIKNSGKSTCAGGVANRSSYWVPAMIDTTTGKVIAPSGSLWYYKTGYNGVKDADIKPVPNGLRMITGDMNSGTSTAIGAFSCDDGSVINSRSILNCKAGSGLNYGIGFPQCWDGKNLDSPDHKSHMAFAKPGVGCPATHPIAIPDIALNIHYETSDADESKTWRLSSDRSTLPPGTSAHADFFDGWDPRVMDTFVKNCINKRVDCHAYLLGNGTTLQ
jgi:hypothetical protein